MLYCIIIYNIRYNMINNKYLALTTFSKANKKLKFFVIMSDSINNINNIKLINNETTNKLI